MYFFLEYFKAGDECLHMTTHCKIEWNETKPQWNIQLLEKVFVHNLIFEWSILLSGSISHFISVQFIQLLHFCGHLKVYGTKWYETYYIWTWLISI